MEQLVLDIMRETMLMIIKASLPLLLTGLVIGLVISIFQTATSIQEQTLSFVPKIIGVFVASILFGPWIINILQTYTIRMFSLFSTLL
ncbi:flagellar biosynthesis protein FliQ [Cellulosilyticum ruminicola]|uniref:flagellar biosynthesis protein FliQ n=1 Tax=Cellulosilyticum ruminicola TaxID=425254 RepID=UPI0006CFC984|nr:flagellar biosynthesis protein FliQ [Cellulosilyticum ruminicola]